MSLENALHWVEAHPGLASWVQAFGSIAAIMVAIWLSSREARYRMRVERQARKDAIERAHLVAENCRTRVIQALATWKNGLQTRGLQSAVMASLNQALFPLRAFETESGADAEICGHIASVRHAVEGVLNEFNQVFEEIERPELTLSPIHGYQASITEAVSKLKSMCAPKPSVSERIERMLIKATK
ncbi:hypothetical protein O162_08830 [Pseudomonas putida SJ3]|nr:hypothetical protein O162_08830 [Pseudomonas putida SJ3]